jgi:hypothetical protein
MANWFDNFIRGYETGDQHRRDNALRGGLKKLDEQQLEEIRPEPKTQSEMLAAQEEGLTTARQADLPQATGYRYGDQTFTARPSQAYLDATKLRQAAGLYTEFGDDPIKGFDLRAAATKQLADSYKTIAEQAFAVGTPEALVSAYSLMPDGYSARLEPGENGTLRVMHFPDGQPEQATELFSGTPEEIVDWGKRSASPDLYLKFGDAAFNRSYRESLMADREEVRAGRLQYQRDQTRARDMQRVQARLNQVQEQLKYLTGDDLAQALQQVDTLNAELDRLMGGDGLGAATGAGGGGQNTPSGDSVMTPEFVDYLGTLERERGLPSGVMQSLAQQESRGRNLGYHYKPDANGKRKSSASGIFGILDSTGRDPGYGVAPLTAPAYLLSPEEQARFAADYLAARIDGEGGNVELGLAGYGEGLRYARQVQQRIGTQAPASNATPKTGLTPAQPTIDQRYRERAAAFEKARQRTAVKPPTIDQWTALQSSALDNLSADEKFNALSQEAKRRKINEEATRLWNDYLQVAGQGGAALGSGGPLTIDGAAARLAGGGAAPTTGLGNGGGTPQSVPQTGSEASTRASSVAETRAKDKASAAEDQAVSALRYTESMAGTAQSKNDAAKMIKTIESNYELLSVANKKRADDLLVRLHTVLQTPAR